MSEQQELRQASNKCSVIGVVKEHNLEVKENDKKENYISGNLVVRTTPLPEEGADTNILNEVRVRVYVQELTKEGKVKKGYETLKKFIDGEYKTLVNGGAEEASVVRIAGSKDFVPKIAENLMPDESKTNMKSMIGIELGFGNVTVDASISPETFEAKFDIEMFVAKVEEEIKDDEPTGRAIISGLVPSYGGNIFPLTLVVENEEFASDVLSDMDTEETYNFWGDIRFTKQVEKVIKGNTGKSFGKTKEEENVTFINEFIIDGCEGVSDNKQFEVDAIETAIKQRTIKIEEKLKEAKEKDNKGTGFKNKGNKTGNGDKKKSNKNFGF